MMDFKPVDTEKLKQVIVEQTGEGKVQVTVPTGKYLVIDPEMLGTSVDLGDGTEAKFINPAAIVGEIEYPLDFCPSDTGACPHGTGAYFGLYRDDGSGPILYYHSECYRPTRKYWDAHFREIVAVAKGFKLPWA
jgi:hypothetical protein